MSGTIYGFNHETACLTCLMFHGLAVLTIKLCFSISKQIRTSAHILYFRSKKELNYNRFVDPNILGTSRLVHDVHSDLRIYRISIFLLDKMSDFGDQHLMNMYTSNTVPGGVLPTRSQTNRSSISTSGHRSLKP